MPLLPRCGPSENLLSLLQVTRPSILKLPLAFSFLKLLPSFCRDLREPSTAHMALKTTATAYRPHNHSAIMKGSGGPSTSRAVSEAAWRASTSSRPKKTRTQSLSDSPSDVSPILIKLEGSAMALIRGQQEGILTHRTSRKPAGEAHFTLFW